MRASESTTPGAHIQQLHTRKQQTAHITGKYVRSSQSHMREVTGSNIVRDTGYIKRNFRRWNPKLLVCYTWNVSTTSSTFRGSLSVLPAKANIAPLDCPETSVNNYQHMLHNNPEERKTHTAAKGQKFCIFPRKLWRRGLKWAPVNVISNS
jgi:hypothetical protein